MTYDDIAHRLEVVANKAFDSGDVTLARTLWGIEDDLVALSSRPATPENVETL